jgi:hypothetical protein
MMPLVMEAHGAPLQTSTGRHAEHIEGSHEGGSSMQWWLVWSDVHPR